MELKNFRIIGPYRGPTGYDNHVRQICKTLMEQERTFELREFTLWNPVVLPEKWLSTISSFPSSQKEKPSLCLHFTMPDQVALCEGILNVNFSMFEATSIPLTWRMHSEQHDHIIVPTLSSANAWIRSGIDKNKISICPLGVDPEIFKPGIIPMDLGVIAGKPVHEYGVRILNVSDFIPRKNIAGLLRAWLEATDNSDDAVLILKPGLYHRDMALWVENEIAGIEEKAGKKFTQAAPICWITDLLPPDVMPSLYAAGTHYISMSHGEGWDLPMMEAGACGLQLIAPRHSAYENWMDEEWTTFIPSTEIDVPEEHPSVFLNGLRFWQPDHTAAVEIIRLTVKGKLTVGAASDAIRNNYTWGNTTKCLLEILDGLYNSTIKTDPVQTSSGTVTTAFMELCSTKMYRYTLQGIGSQLIEMMPDFSVGVLGYVPMGIPRQWSLEENANGSPKLTIFPEQGTVISLGRDEDGNWKGANEQVEVLLEPVFETCTPEEKIKYHTLQEEFIASLQTIDLKPGSRGIVIPGGGEKYFPGAWALIHLLRITLKCDLPIELWHLGAEELPRETIPALEKLNVSCRDAYAEGYTHTLTERKGWPLKTYALLHTAFTEVLLLDSDNVPVRDPSFLFDDVSYKKTGALFWPDFGALHKSRTIWDVCGIAYRDEPEFESGQLLVDRSKHFNALQLAMFYNTHAHFYYRLINGDKETFHMAWRRLNSDYTLISTPIFHLPYTMVQHDLSGARLFQHRYGDKLRRAGNNYRIDGFMHERECIGFVQQLNHIQNIAIQRNDDAIEFIKQAEEKICTIRTFEYERINHDKRMMEFLPGGIIGAGNGRCEQTWRMDYGNGICFLLIEGEEGLICKLSQAENSSWEGRWLMHERMYVVLRAAE